MDGQITPSSTIDEYRDADFSRLHSLVGPVAVRGAEPGDVLAVEMLDFQHEGWGWTVIEPIGGLLTEEDFNGVHDLHIWHVDGEGYAVFKPGIRVPVQPFAGHLGVAPAESGAHWTGPPRPTGGNMDVRHLGIGSTVFLPVAVPGALFSTGDCHLAQGDGEVCLTAIEAPMTVTMRFSLHKGRTIAEPQYITRRAALAAPDESGAYATTASGPDLLRNAKQAVRYMIEFLVAEHGLTRNEAYMLCSVAGDLKIAQLAQLGSDPVSMVAFHMPRGILGS